MGSFAVQLINGVSITVIFLSRAEGRVRLAITPGTVQPKPISIGTMLLPESPILRRSLSVTKATRAIYPLSSSIDRKKKSVTIIGTKLSMLPTPLKIPSTIRECRTGFMFAAERSMSTASHIQFIPNSKSF